MGASHSTEHQALLNVVFRAFEQLEVESTDLGEVRLIQGGRCITFPSAMITEVVMALQEAARGDR